MIQRKHPRPWYRPSRELWFVTLNGKQINLGPDEDEAYRQYHELMVRRAAHPTIQPVALTALTLAEVIEEFLEFVSRERAPDTYEWYRYRLKRLHERYPDMLAESIKPIDVRRWLDAYDFSITSRHNHMRTIKTCLRWAATEQLIATNPLQYMKLPRPDRRDVYIPPDEFQDILSFVSDPSFRDLLIVTYETGCRPQESRRVEARHVDTKHQRWVLSWSEEKMKRQVRVVYLTERAMAITRERMQRYPTGPLFRNSKDKPWQKYSVSCGFDRIQLNMGKREMQSRNEVITEEAIQAFVPTLSPTMRRKGKKVTKTAAELRREAKRKLTRRRAVQLAPHHSLYVLRHSWATNALKRGVDALTVAILMGHNDPGTLSRTYQHLNHSPDHLLNQARRAAG